MKMGMNFLDGRALLPTLALTALMVAACTQSSPAAPASTAPIAATAISTETLTDTQPLTQNTGTTNTTAAGTEGATSEIVVYTADLPESAIYELELWEDAAAAGGVLLGVTNNGDELDPPPENDPHVTFTVQVQAGIPYRCWIHMKVGTPDGASTANVIWVQLSNAVDKANQPVFQPESASFLTAQGPAQEGWSWVECALEGAETAEPVLSFNTSGEITVLVQAGMEGVGFDQFLLSSVQFLEEPPVEAIVKQESVGQ